MLLDLVGGITLGMATALLCYTINTRLKPITQVVMWATAGYGAYLALASFKPTMPISQVIANVSAGALYGAFLAGLVLAPLSRIVGRILRAKPLSDA